jgi:hypothetical protein
MTKSARGMPSVELSQNTKDAIEAEETKDEEMKREDPFVKPNLEIKTTETLAPIAEVEEQRVVKKPKKKLTEKQLEALKRGRVKSAETRKKKAEEKRLLKEEKNAPKNHIQTAEAMRPQPQPAPQIDYDRIINGVGNLWGKQQQQQQQVAEVEFNVAEFEKKVREDEKNKVYADLDKIQQEEAKIADLAVAKNHLQRQPQSLNPYAYAFNLNSRSRYQRY